MRLGYKRFSDMELAILYAIELDLKYGCSQINPIGPSKWEVYSPSKISNESYSSE